MKSGMEKLMSQALAVLNQSDAVSCSSRRSAIGLILTCNSETMSLNYNCVTTSPSQVVQQSSALQQIGTVWQNEVPSVLYA